MMKKIGILLLGLVFSFCTNPNEEIENDTFILNYDAPAEQWTEALPIGNGSLGAMVYGGVTQEHIQFNEETLWRGEPHDYAHKGAAKFLPKIRELLTQGKQIAAQDLAQEEFMSEPLKQVHYQPFADIYIDFPHDSVSGLFA